MRKRAIGLEFADRAVNFVDFTNDRGRHVINRWEVISLPPGLIVDGGIKDLGELTQLIKPLFSRQNMFNPVPVIVGVSGLEACVRKIVIPSVPIHEMDQVVAWEGENILPYPIHEVFSGYQILNRSEGETEILFVALLREYMNNYLQIFKQLHLPVHLLTLQTLGLANYVHYAGEFVGYSGILARMRLGSIDFVLLHEGQIEIIRTIALKSSHASGVDFFIAELRSTLEHFHMTTGIWLNTGFFFGDKRFLQVVRAEMPAFHWRHLQLLENKEQSEPITPMAAEELPCAMGLSLAGVM